MMRKIILLFALLLSFMGGKAVAQQAKSSAKILVAYFSYSGNTRTVAEQIQKATGADIFEIKVKDAYPSDYQELLDKAKKQIGNHTRPALVSMPKNLSQYDIILIGSPNCGVRLRLRSQHSCSNAIHPLSPLYRSSLMAEAVWRNAKLT